MVDLNLDELQPESKSFQLGGKVYTMQPPTIELIIKLSEIQQQSMDAKFEDLPTIANTIRGILQEICPELEKLRLTYLQAQALMKFAAEMATPKENKELAEQGISVATDDEKKILPAS